MPALKKRYYQKIDEEVYSAILDNGMSLSSAPKFVDKKAAFSRNPFFLMIDKDIPLSKIAE